MIQRTFEFAEGTSNKFWTISLDGKSHTVNFGRIGTAGQMQSKEFGSEAEAQKSFDKLVAEKVKKGYVEKGAPTGSASAMPAPRSAPAQSAAVASPPPPVSRPAAPASTKPTAAPAATSSIPAPPPAGTTGVRREIELHFTDCSYLPAERAAPTPREPAQPFDHEDCLERLRTKVRVRTYGWDWDFSRAIPDRALAPEEAEFWLTIMTMDRDRQETTAAAAEKLAKRQFMGRMPKSPKLGNRYIGPQAVQCLAALLSPEEMRELLLNPAAAQGKDAWQNGGAALRAGFRLFVLSHLDDAEIARWQSAARAAWDPSAWPADFYKAPAPAFYFGALLGLHDEVRALITTWPDNLYVDASWDHTHYHCPQEVVFGAGSAEQVSFHFRRLKLPLNSEYQIRTFLSLTSLSALDVIARTIANTGKKEDAEELFAGLALVHAPDAAPLVLDLALNSKAPRVAREWLEQNVNETVAGLIPVAAGNGKLAEAAVEYLNSVKRRGRADLIAEQLGGVAPEVAARVRSLVLEVVELQLPELPRDATPAWWREALAQAPLKPGKPKSWPKLTDLSTVVLGEHALGPEHITELLGALQASTLEAPHPLLRPLRQHAAPDRLDAFGSKLFDLWMGEGAPPKEKWAFFATGFLGGDRTVLKLAPLIRAWPGEAQHQRAVTGLEVLRTIGTDTALMQINGIAQKVKFKGLKERAIQCMDAIAEKRGMTRAQLEDRIVPDCGLDERGAREFDFGPRQFRFVLGAEMKPMIRYPDGSTKPDLPKPGAKDDATKAEPAVAEWKLLKKQIGEVAKIQAVRLEQAMVTGRRWTAEEFQLLLVRHPLMINLVRLIVWAVYDASGAVAATFRVTEDQTLGDAADQPFTLVRDAHVGVVHPLQLTKQPHVLEQWGQLFGDYEIVPPFPQLGRPGYSLKPEQIREKEITHFKSRGKLPAQSLVFGLEKLGWQRGIPQDGGWVGEHSKQFYGASVTAVINYHEGFSVGYWEGAGDQTIERVFFIPGLYAPKMYPDHKNAMRLADVDPIALSEVIGDCELLLTKAK